MKTEAFPTYLKFSELLSSDRTQEAVAFFERGFRKGDSLEWPGEMVVFGFSPLCVFKCILKRIQITLHNDTGFRKGDFPCVAGNNRCVSKRKIVPLFSEAFFYVLVIYSQHIFDVTLKIKVSRHCQEVYLIISGPRCTWRRSFPL